MIFFKLLLKITEYFKNIPSFELAVWSRKGQSGMN
jgi:hypothetical protein